MSSWMKQAVVHNGVIRCKGLVHSGGGRWPELVELASDGGFSWYAVPSKNMSKKHKWTWRTWEFGLPGDVEGWIEIVCRCWDKSVNTQPLNVRATWNRGLRVTSSAHRISVYSRNKSRDLTKQRLDKFEHLVVPLAPTTCLEEFQTQS